MFTSIFEKSQNQVTKHSTRKRRHKINYIRDLTVNYIFAKFSFFPFLHYGHILYTMVTDHKPFCLQPLTLDNHVRLALITGFNVFHKIHDLHRLVLFCTDWYYFAQFATILHRIVLSCTGFSYFAQEAILHSLAE